MTHLRIDLRSLALLRVFLSFLLLCDLLTRIGLVEDFYTDAGVMPRAALLLDFVNPWFFSVFNIAGQSFHIYLLCGLAGFSYLMMLAGYRTKLFTVLSWVFFVSFTARAPFAVHGGDDLIRLCLFWMIFLPSNSFYSVDRALQPDTILPSKTILNVSSIALVLQLVLVYFMTALLKWHPIWMKEGSAIYYALELDQFLTPFGHWIRSVFPIALFQFLTRITLLVEFIFPLLIFVPFKNDFLRKLVISTFLFFHFNLFLIFQLGTFPWICMIYWLVLIPSSLWDQWLEKLKSKQKAVLLYYDGECGSCFKLAQILKVFLILPFVEIKRAQEEEKVFQLMKHNNSWVIKKNGSSHFHFEGFIELVRVSPFSRLNFLFEFKVIKSLGRIIYLRVAQNRAFVGGLLNQLSIEKIRIKSPQVTQIFVAFLFAIAVYWNVALYSKADDWKFPDPIWAVGSVLRLHQQWNMFAPYPSMDDGWLVVEGQLSNQTQWDVFHNQPVSFEKPQNVADQFENVFWRKYLLNLWSKSFSKHRLYFGRYVCRNWNDKLAGQHKLMNFKLYYMLENSVAAGLPKQDPVKELIWDHNCFLK